MVSCPASMKISRSLQMSSSDRPCPVSGSVASISARTSGASRLGSARQAWSMSAAICSIDCTAAAARRRAGVGSQRGARIGRSARSAVYDDATCMCSAMVSALSLRSTPSTERPSDCMVSRRHSWSRSTSPPVDHASVNCSAARDIWPPNARTLCLVNTGCNARLRGRHGSLGSTNRLSPAMSRTSSCTMHRSENASLRPRTSRMASGEKTATNGGNSHFGATWIRVTGPPAPRMAS